MSKEQFRVLVPELPSMHFICAFQSSENKQDWEANDGRTNVFKISFRRGLEEAKMIRFPASLLKAGIESACAETCWRIVVIEGSRTRLWRPLFVTFVAT
jgi:hypothetical protein